MASEKDIVELVGAKEFYETFKNHLTDSDLSDDENIEYLDEGETIEDINHDPMLKDPLELFENAYVRIERLDNQLLMPARKRGRPKKIINKNSSADHCLNIQELQKTKEKLIKNIRCQRCSQRFNHQKFLAAHSLDQCDRQLSFLDRRNKRQS